MAKLVYGHIFLCGQGLLHQTQRKGDAPPLEIAHAPAAYHVPHTDFGQALRHTVGKQRKQPLANGLHLHKRLGLIGKRGTFGLCLRGAGLFGMGDPIGILGHKAVCLCGAGPQGGRNRNLAIAVYMQMHLLDAAAHQLVFYARRTAGLGGGGTLFHSRAHGVTLAHSCGKGKAWAAVPAAPHQT